MKRQITTGLLLLCFGTFVWAQSDQTSGQKESTGSSELQKATDVVEHMSASAPDKGVPKQLLEGRSAWPSSPS